MKRFVIALSILSLVAFAGCSHTGTDDVPADDGAAAVGDVVAE